MANCYLLSTNEDKITQKIMATCNNAKELRDGINRFVNKAVEEKLDRELKT